MTPYELLRTLAIPILPVLQGRIHGDLKRLLRAGSRGSPKGDELPAVLDIGGRSSPYTSGLGARITLLDLPRETPLQEDLQLGMSQRILERLERRRSNIERVLIEDMCRSSLPDAVFDGAVAVEVLEHVPEDDRFVGQVARILRPGGWAYFTTPNGEWVKNEPPNYNPDHLRHYTRAQLQDLLGRHFDQVHVVYAVKTGVHRRRGLYSFELRRPVRLVVGMVSNLVNHWQSRGLDETPRRTAHLVAIARKAGNR